MSARDDYPTVDGLPQTGPKRSPTPVVRPSGPTLEAAQNVGRHAIGIDLDPRNADLAQQRVGMFMEVTP